MARKKKKKEKAHQVAEIPATRPISMWKLVRAKRKGALRGLPWARNTGDSNRTSKQTTAMRATELLIRYGTLQPHACMSTSSRRSESVVKVIFARKRPNAMPNAQNEPKRPRLKIKVKGKRFAIQVVCQREGRREPLGV